MKIKPLKQFPGFIILTFIIQVAHPCNHWFFFSLLLTTWLFSILPAKYYSHYKFKNIHKTLLISGSYCRTSSSVATLSTKVHSTCQSFSTSVTTCWDVLCAGQCMGSFSTRTSANSTCWTFPTIFTMANFLAKMVATAKLLMAYLKKEKRKILTNVQWFSWLPLDIR